MGRLLVGLVIAMALVGCKRSAPVGEEGPGMPCAIEARPLGEEGAEFVTLAVIEAAGNEGYVLRQDTNRDGVWDRCVRAVRGQGGGWEQEIDNGCDGSVDFRATGTREEGHNLVGIVDEFGAESTLIVSAVPADFVSELLSYTLPGPRTNFKLEFDESGRVTTLVDHGKSTRFMVDKAGRILKVLGEEGSILGYEYDGSGRMTQVHWFKRDLLLRLNYVCSPPDRT